MKKDELKRQWQKSEENQKGFIGWNFAYLKDKYFQEEIPWSYSKIVISYLKPDFQLLDMGTGGGELLRSFQHPDSQTSVTEGWEKNYQLLLKTLKPKGVEVQFVADDDILNFPNDSFDIVINSHESFSIKEVKRVLKSHGLFISQQVGDLNGINLASRLIPKFQKHEFKLHLASVLEDLKRNNFAILYENESYPIQKFFDMDSLIYYVRTIPWEFQNFSVENNYDQLAYLQRELQRNGYIHNQQHRFVFVAKNNKEQ